MTAPETLTGYRFDYRACHLGTGRSRSGHQVVAVARNLAEAFVAAARVVPLEGLRLVDRGSEVLEAASRFGIRAGDAGLCPSGGRRLKAAA